MWFNGKIVAVALSLSVIFASCQRSSAVSLPSHAYYIAGVVEFPALGAHHTLEDTQDRLSEFRQLIEGAAVRPDIVVFPENVLNNHTHPVRVPVPLVGVIPCIHDGHDFVISEVSCYARSLQLYLLVNVVELDGCPSTDKFAPACHIYNTNVVFDRTGAVISRYRKYNLLGSEWLYYNYTQQPEAEATFGTDFNVTFGHFTRMDLLYYRPAQTLVAQGIADFLHPSKWQSELPFMTAMQLHQSWAYSNNVNLLVAGTNDPRTGRTGTGIYAARHGALIASMTTDETRRKLFLSVVPKRGYEATTTTTTADGSTARQQAASITNRITGINVARDNDLDLYTTLALPPFEAAEGTVEASQHEVCHHDLCCHFQLRRSAIVDAATTTTTATPLPEAAAAGNAPYVHYFYRLAAYRGFGKFLNTEPEAVAVCALFACTGDHLYTCGRIHPETVTVQHRFNFDLLAISGNFSTARPHLMLPTSVDGMLQPLPVQAYDFQVQQRGNVSRVNHTLLQPKADLLSFGIFVNYYSDETIYDHHKNGANQLQAVLCTLLLTSGLRWLAANCYTSFH